MLYAYKATTPMAMNCNCHRLAMNDIKGPKLHVQISPLLALEDADGFLVQGLCLWNMMGLCSVRAIILNVWGYHVLIKHVSQPYVMKPLIWTTPETKGKDKFFLDSIITVFQCFGGLAICYTLIRRPRQ